MGELGSERQRAAWRGLPAWRVASGDLWVVVCPARGGKITSLFDVRRGVEWLVPPPLVATVRPLTYGALWSAYEMCGWDDVFPTLGECDHPGPGRSSGVRLPDHGEVWSKEWTDETAPDGSQVVCSVTGAAVPYLLRRSLTVDGPTLRLAYSLLNTGDDELPYQWLAHAMVRRTPRTEVRTSAADGWATVLDGETGASLRFDWDARALPWLAVLGDDEEADAALAAPHVVVSPTTAVGPDLRAAVEAHAVLVLAPGAVAAWSLHATVGG